MPLPHATATCVVCAGALGPRARSSASAERYPTCTRIDCRMVVARRQTMGELAFVPYLQRHASQLREIAARERRLQSTQAAAAHENAIAWHWLRQHKASAAGTALLQLLLPSGPARSRRIGSVRRGRYRTHLRAVIAAARKGPESQAQASAAAVAQAAADAIDAAIAASALPGRLCALCGGGCCTRGNDHAYVVPSTIAHFLLDHPDMSDADILCAYLERLPAAAREGSCINHTAHGCALPRNMRSSTCNKYVCDALGQVQAAQRAGGPAPVLLVLKRQRDQWQRETLELPNALVASAVLTERQADVIAGPPPMLALQS